MISKRYLLGLLFEAIANDELRFKTKFLTFDKKFKLTEKETYYYNRLLEMFNSLNDIK
jgi:hypothetical protein